MIYFKDRDYFSKNFFAFEAAFAFKFPGWIDSDDQTN